MSSFVDERAQTEGRRGYLELPLRRLAAHVALSEGEHKAVRELSAKRIEIGRGERMVPPDAALHFVLDGWGCQARTLADGRRQIFDIVLPGDLIGQSIIAVEREAGVSWTALTSMILAPAADLCRHEGIRAGLLVEQRHAQRRQYDHMLRLGVHTAYERVAHLMLELHERLSVVGLAVGDRFPFPLGQERLGEILGLSGMHIHRTLTKLRNDGFLEAAPGWYALARRDELADHVEFYPPGAQRNTALLESYPS